MGSSAIGNDNVSQLQVLVRFWAQLSVRHHYPAYVLAVQFPRRSANYANGRNGIQVSVPDACLVSALALVDSLQRVLPVDAGRIYTLGFSMDGSTAYNALVARPDLFAAGICISGIPPENCAARIRGKALWIIHGNRDDENPIAGDQALYSQLRDQQGAKVLFWEIQKGGHSIYAPLFQSEILPRWLFSKHK